MLAAVVVLVPWVLLSFRVSQRYLQFFQIEEYDNVRFVQWITNNARALDRALFLSTSSLILFSGATALAPSRIVALSLIWLVLWLGLGIYLLSGDFRRKRDAKIPLVYTARAKRILITAFLLQVAIPVGYLLAVVAWPADVLLPASQSVITFAGSLAGLSTLAAPLLLVVANLVLYPLEALLRWRFLLMAQERLKGQRATIIGITGSYGKTSTKDILYHILEARYRVAKTPKSYNTLMGITKIINNGGLRPSDQFFIAEVGAYKPGEITRLCELLKPTVGIITAVGPMHLERFKTLENTARAKYELIQSLPVGGLAVFNADDDLCYDLARKTTRVTVAMYGVEKHQDELFVRAENVQITPQGLSFTLVQSATGECVQCKTRLLGRHNVSNILAATAVALHTGMTLNEIARQIGRLEPTPHRLELRTQKDGITVIDDAYNSNPTGARNALDVLSGFQEGRRILVTPGFVELGDIESLENRRLGEYAADLCNFVILVGGAKTDPIKEGLQAKSFPSTCLVQVPTLSAALVQLRSIARSGDTVLMLNDLPDTYELAAK